MLCKQDLKCALQESSARWKIVVGHHSIRSVSIHGDTAELLQYLLPVLQVIDYTSKLLLIPYTSCIVWSCGINFVFSVSFTICRKMVLTFMSMGMTIASSTLAVLTGKFIKNSLLFWLNVTGTQEQNCNTTHYCYRCLIVCTKSPLQYFTSGGGSKAWRGAYIPNTDKLRFFYDGQGFMSLKLTKSDADIAFYDVSGQQLHKWSMAKINQGPLLSNVAM